MLDIGITHPQIGKTQRHNFSLVTIGNTDFYFSYTTLIAFRFRGFLVCSENVWSQTTGKHLNYIQPDKKLRTDTNTYNELVEQLLDTYTLLHNGVKLELFLRKVNENAIELKKESDFQNLHKKING